jgi:hypothetical protein
MLHDNRLHRHAKSFWRLVEVQLFVLLSAAGAGSTTVIKHSITSFSKVKSLKPNTEQLYVYSSGSSPDNFESSINSKESLSVFKSGIFLSPFLTIFDFLSLNHDQELIVKNSLGPIAWFESTNNIHSLSSAHFTAPLLI